HRAAAMDVARHDADLAFTGRDHAGAIGADQPRLGARERTLHFDHVQHRNAFGDANDQRDLRIDGFQDGVGGERRRHIDGGRIRADFLFRLAHRVEHGQAQMGLAAFARRGAAHHLGAIGDGLFGMEGPLRASKALADDLGVLVDENGHVTYEPFTALTTFWAASARLSAEVMARPDLARICLPNSTLVPSRRTTRGTFSEISFAAATMPSAMMSHFMMPPKMLTRMPFTLGSLTMILKACVTFSLVAPPPTSRKLAGSLPYNLMMSMVAMARPAPLTMQPISPSSLM